MWIIIGLMFFGAGAGFILSRGQNMTRIFERITFVLIYILLFLMGMSIGVDPGIMSGLKDLGLQAFTITLFSISGSVILALLVYRFLFKVSVKKSKGQDS